MSLERVDSIPTLPKRPTDSHKGLYGFVLVIAGGRGMAGAAALAGVSALRSGAGLVQVACPAEVQPVVASFEPSYMTYPLPDERGSIRLDEALDDLEPLVARADAVAVGPGLGRSDDIRRLVAWLISSTAKPLVIDADALNALVGQTGLLAGLTRPVVLTPHPGEFARLVGLEIAEVQAGREAQAAGLAARSASHLVVVLKGASTVVTDGRRVYVNTTGNPGMATGGSGDILTGIIAGLMGQRLPAFDAARLGTYIHGLAGDIARDNSGELGMIAGDIVDALPDAFHHGLPDPA